MFREILPDKAEGKIDLFNEVADFCKVRPL